MNSVTRRGRLFQCVRLIMVGVGMALAVAGCGGGGGGGGGSTPTTPPSNNNPGQPPAPPPATP